MDRSSLKNLAIILSAASIVAFIPFGVGVLLNPTTIQETLLVVVFLVLLAFAAIVAAILHLAEVLKGRGQ